MNKNKNTKLAIRLFLFIILTLTIYFIIIVLKYPLIGIEVKRENDQWIVESIYEKGWAASQQIKEGDIVELINEKKPDKFFSVNKYNRVEMVKSITISDRTYPVSYRHFEVQYIVYLFFPLLFNLMTLLLSLFLYRRAIEDRSAVILICFLLTIGICYLSASGSARGDIVGRVISTISLPSSLVLFVHFLKSYLQRFNLIFIKSRSLLLLYVLNFFLLFIIGINFLLNQVNFNTTSIELFYLLLYIFILLLYLVWFYVKNKDTEANNILKMICISLFLTFSPFVFVYIIPTILFKQQLISAEYTSIFLIIIPIVFVYMQLAENIFDIDFLLSRLKYYALLSLPFTILTVFLLNLIHAYKISLNVLIFSFVFICTIVFLYIKEYLDYKFRIHLFSQKGNFEASLYNFFQRVKHETKVTNLINKLIEEIDDVLLLKKIINIEMFSKDGEMNWMLQNKKNLSPSFVKSLKKVDWDSYPIGSVIQMMNGYCIILVKEPSYKNIIYFRLQRSKTSLNIQEKIWLETLSYFSSILFENLQIIEDLFKRIKKYEIQKDMKNENNPYWLSRLLFALSEKERTNLSIDLHNSVLQDQLQLLREVEKIQLNMTDEKVKEDLFVLKERMLDNIHLIRETCNELRPPFLNEFGIIPSIQNLIDQTKLRCNFILKESLDESIKSLDKEQELIIYRVIQELLNNATKHSQASNVTISLRMDGQVLFLIYEDNGIGFHMNILNDSRKTMGVLGMIERINSIGGNIDIHSSPGNGTHVFIKIHTGGNKNDSCFNCR